MKRIAWNKGLDMKTFKKEEKPAKDLTNKIFFNWTILEFKEWRTNYDNGREAYWSCKCKCGKIKTIRQSYITCNRTKSCGCLRNELFKQNTGKRVLPNNLSAKNIIFKTYEKTALKRNIEFKLSFEELNSLIEKPCYYCNEKSSNIIKSRWGAKDYSYNGIDRVNNDLGYDLSNCVSCCDKCNWMKREFKKDDFINHINKIYSHSICLQQLN